VVGVGNAHKVSTISTPTLDPKSKSSKKTMEGQSSLSTTTQNETTLDSKIPNKETSDTPNTTISTEPSKELMHEETTHTPATPRKRTLSRLNQLVHCRLI